MQPAFLQHRPDARRVRSMGHPDLAAALHQMPPTTLTELEGVSLLNRIDTKFLLTASQLAAVLPSLTGHYSVLELEGRRLHRYRTLYFDTLAFDLYRQHHAGQSARHKVRSRLYLDSGLSFFEIKAKRGRRTIKHRLATPEFVTELTPEATAFANRHLSSACALQPTLRNDFVRVTLVERQHAERLTLDFGIQFACMGRAAVLPGIVIAEVKRDIVGADSPFLQAMRTAHSRPTSISKYCVGVGLLVAQVEHDAFDAKLRTIERLMRSQRGEPPMTVAGVAAS